MNGPALVHDLAIAIGGEVRAGTLIIILSGDDALIVDCTATGKVVLTTPNGGSYQLGSIGDGVEHLASMFYAATAEVPC